MRWWTRLRQWWHVFNCESCSERPGWCSFWDDEPTGVWERP